MENESGGANKIYPTQLAFKRHKIPLSAEVEEWLFRKGKSSKQNREEY